MSQPHPTAPGRRQRLSAGVTMVELVVVVVIVSILAAVAVPAFSSWMDDQRLKAAARSVGDAFNLARAEAIRTGQDHIVFLSSGAGVDPAPAGRDAGGATLVDESGAAVPILVLNDGQPGSADNNCRIDGGESSRSVPAELGVSWGVTGTTTPAPEDPGSTIPANGVTFSAPDGTPTTWVLFRPDGIPVGFDTTCTQGETGSGGGTVYVTNGDLDYAVTLTALGTVRVHRADRNGGWTQ